MLALRAVWDIVLKSMRMKSKFICWMKMIRVGGRRKTIKICVCFALIRKVMLSS